MGLTAVELEQRYGDRLRQQPFAGAESARYLWQCIRQHLPRVDVTEGQAVFLLLLI